MSSIRRAIMLKLAASAIPLAAGLSVIVKKATDYSVTKGDTLSGIARRNNTTWQEIAKLNGITDPDRLSLGQKLKIPSPAPRVVPPAQPVPETDATRLNRVSAYLHGKLNNPALESALLANFNRETGGTFDYRTQEKGGGGGYGIPQYTGPSLKAYRAWLAKNKFTDSEKRQLDYFTDVYMPSRAGYRVHMSPGSSYTREQYADWLHRRVFTPAHTISGNKAYSPALTLRHTLAHNDFMKNKLKDVNGVWQGV